MKNTLIFSLLFIFLFGSCVTKEEKSNSSLEHKPTLKKQYIIHNTQELKSLEYDYPNLIDKNHKLNISKLNKKEKIALLQDVLKFEDNSPMDKYYLQNDLQAFVIDNLKPLNNNKPILIQTYGTDYSSLNWIILDKKGDKIVGITLYGGENSGPELNEDTLIVSRPKTYCIFNKNKVNCFEKIYSYNPQSINKQVYIDSTVNEFQFNGNKINKKTIFETGFERVMDIDTLKMY